MRSKLPPQVTRNLSSGAREYHMPLSEKDNCFPQGHVGPRCLKTLKRPWCSWVRCRWFETPSHSLWRHCNDDCVIYMRISIFRGYPACLRMADRALLTGYPRFMAATYYVGYTHEALDSLPVTRDGGDSLQWRHNGHYTVSNHQPHDCLLSRLFRSRSKKTSKLRVTGLSAGNSPGTGEFPAQMASNA